MTSKYLVKKLSGRIFLRSFDVLLAPFREKTRTITPPRKILLCNTAHLGDVIIASSVIPLIEKAFPQAQIGFLIGSWAKGILENHPKISHIHLYDHWKLNRSPIPFWKKFKRYLLTSVKALREIKEVQYDLAIDLYLYFPNSIPLLFRAGIPHRIAYVSGGFSSLMTRGLLFERKGMHLSLYLEKLVQSILPIADRKPFLPPSLPQVSVSSKKEPFYLIHVGSGNRTKLWPEKKWQALIALLEEEKKPLFFSGVGKNEEERINRVIEGRKRCFNYSNRFSLQEIRALLAQAYCVISIDSMMGHLAAAASIPSLVLYANQEEIPLWRPPSKKTILFPLTCSAEEIYPYLMTFLQEHR